MAAQTASSRRARPSSRHGFEIAIICALTLEADAVGALFDRHWDDDGPPFDKAPGDPNAYSTGAIGRHNVVLAHMPGMGKANAAAVAANCRVSFPNIRLALVVGICGVVPFGPSNEIILGDVIISDGVVQYDLGRQLPDRFVRKDTLLHSLGRPNLEIRGLLAKLKTLQSRKQLGTKMATYLSDLRDEPLLDAGYPGVAHDRLFEATYRHLGGKEPCEQLGCNGNLVPRERLQEGKNEPQPTIHFGLVASGDLVMKSGEDRDAIAEKEGIIAFEMESAGAWDTFPCIVIKGACDYADSHKSKSWQRYAAATAAACMKAFLSRWVPSLPAGVDSTSCIATSDPKWFFDFLEGEVQQTHRHFHSSPNHIAEDYLLGFINTTIFSSWLTSPGSILWCRLKADIDGPVDGKVGACLSKQATQHLSGPVNVFYYRCGAQTCMELPCGYVDRKKEMIRKQAMNAEDNDSLPSTGPELEPPLIAEVTIMSFLMQAMHAGFNISLDEVNPESPPQFLTSLVTSFTKGTESKRGRIFLVLDILDREKDVHEVVGLISSILSHSQEQKYWILLAATETPLVSSALMGYPSVESDSEYKGLATRYHQETFADMACPECLKSLLLEDRSARKIEIADPIRNSNSWIWNHPTFEAFMRTQAGALAIIGKPGSGKSVLAKTIQHGIRNSLRDMIVGDWFYCRRKGATFVAYSSLLQSVLYEFVSKKKSIFQYVKQIYRRKPPTTSRTWSIAELEEILKSLSHFGSPLMMVFDGMDEADDNPMVQFIETLVQTPGSNMRIIVLSRPLKDLERHYWTSRRIILQHENGMDIREIIADGLYKLRISNFGNIEERPDRTEAVRSHAELRSSGYNRLSHGVGNKNVESESNMNDDVFGLEKILLEKTNGVILWLVLVLEALDKFVRRERVVNTAKLVALINDLPIGIDAFYEQIAQELSTTLTKSDLDMARTALMWVNIGSEFKQLTLEELWDAMAIPDDLSAAASLHKSAATILKDGRIPIFSWSDFRRKLEGICGPLIEVLPHSICASDQSNRSFERSLTEISGSSAIQLMHQTVKDFLTTSTAAGALFFRESEALEMIMRHSQNYISLALPYEMESLNPFLPSQLHDWRVHVCQVATYLDECRLLRFCCQLMKRYPTNAAAIWPQTQQIENGFLPYVAQEIPRAEAVRASIDWKYDFRSFDANPLVATALGLVFHFATAAGLEFSVQAMLSLIGLQSESNFWALYKDSVLNGILFTVLDIPDFPKRIRCRRLLTTERGLGRDAAILAIDHLYKEGKCSDLLSLCIPGRAIDGTEVFNAIDLVLRHVFGGNWTDWNMTGPQLGRRRPCGRHNHLLPA